MNTQEKEVKELTITYTIKLATYTPKALVASRDDLYALFDEVYYNSAENVSGVCFLTKSTELKIEGKE
jgi:hypothetical protein